MSSLPRASAAVVMLDHHIDIATPTPAPYWALLERKLLSDIAAAAEEFYAAYFYPDGQQKCVPRWGALDGADDAAENLAGFTDCYALGGARSLLDMFHVGFEGHIRQYTQARTNETDLGRDGMYYREFPASFDWVHNGEGFHALFQQGLCEPWDATYRARMQRFADFYVRSDGEPGATQPVANYDREHRLLRSVMTGSRGPLLRKATPVDWAGDWFECEGRFVPLRSHRTYDDYLAHYQTSTDVVGDSPINLGVAVLPFHAYMLSGDDRYRDWVIEYATAWIERTAANGGIIPSNVGLDGTIGGGADGKWYGGVWGWSQTDLVPDYSHRSFFTSMAPYGFATALLLTGEQRYVDVWRGVIEAVNANARVEDGQPVCPHMHGDDGWYAFSPEPFDAGVLELFYWSLRADDRERVRSHPWVTYLSGENDRYPERRLLEALAVVGRRMEGVRADTMTADTRLSENPNGLNPAEAVWALVELAMGGIATRHRGLPWHVCVRYFDPDERRPGLPEGVAALVDSITPVDDGRTNVALTLVNTDQVKARRLQIQGGAYREHRIERIVLDGVEVRLPESAADGGPIAVRLRPGAGGRLELRMKRYDNHPTLAFPWG